MPGEIGEIWKMDELFDLMGLGARNDGSDWCDELYLIYFVLIDTDLPFCLFAIMYSIFKQFLLFLNSSLRFYIFFIIVFRIILSVSSTFLKIASYL